MINVFPKSLRRFAEVFGTDHFLGVFIMVVFLAFVAPILERFTSVRWLLDLILGFVLLLTILSLSKRPLVAFTASALALFGYIGHLPAFSDGHRLLGTWASGALVLFFLLAAIMILGFVLRARRVDANTIWAALCVYVFMGLLWSFAYGILMVSDPTSFRIPAEFLKEGGVPGVSVYIYYSFVTITTLGYGDMTPLSVSARSLSSLEAMAGQVYLTVLVARLVGMHISNAREEREVSRGISEGQG